MNKKVLHTLEYDKIVALLTEKASSELGKSKCRSLKPMTDMSQIREELLKTDDALGRILRTSTPDFGRNKNIIPAVKTVEVGGSLSAAELLRIAAQLRNAAAIMAYGGNSAPRAEADMQTDVKKRGANDNAGDNTSRGKQDRDSGDEIIENINGRDSLTSLFEWLDGLPVLSGEITRCILAEDEISDDASPELRQIRRKLARIDGRIHDTMNKVLNSLRTILQDAVVTVRNGRYCLPVKAEYKNQINGIVHDTSATGATVFVEPAAVVELNNEIRALEAAEKEEIARILKLLSDSCAPYAHQLTENQRILTELDFIFARAVLALEQKASRPSMNLDHRIDLRRARHPLLEVHSAVPIDVKLGEDYTLLVVTGPNTGGKTVSLKTVGLLTLMGQSGLLIPAGDRSELSIFTEVYADIGDEQSIEQNLSTFSSHMTTIVTILKDADENSLCLFDELGAGTDPVEGAALAVAILDHLKNRGIRTMATTHYSELKVYAMTTPDVENASCEFNVETLRPTYRLLIGIPGKSNAFAISRRLGLPEHIIEAAGEQIETDKQSFEDLLGSLETDRRAIEQEREEIENYKARMAGLKEEMETRHAKLDARRDRIIAEAEEEARNILAQAKAQADEAIRQMNKTGSATVADLERTRRSLGETIKDKNARVSQKNPISQGSGAGIKVSAGDLKLGDTVTISGMGMKGEVVTLPDQKGNLFVMCGMIRTKANVRDILLMPGNNTVDRNSSAGGKVSGSGKSQSGVVHMPKSKALTISHELNIIGRTVEEAMPELDKYLDDAYLSHVQSVRIVHGKGSGILRNAVQRHLRSISYVESYRLGEFGEGDSGVTIVTFK